MPLILGSVVGVPVGIVLLRWVLPSHLRMAIGALLILFSLYNLIRPKLPEVKRGGQAADAGVGFLNGVVGGSTGLAGILIVIWSAMRAWPRDEQRAAFQPTGVATFLITLIALGGSGIITGDILKLFALGLPALAIGTWAGWKLYGKLDEASFRKGVLVLLLVSGVAKSHFKLPSAARTAHSPGRFFLVRFPVVKRDQQRNFVMGSCARRDFERGATSFIRARSYRERRADRARA
jgi:uncharacterized protein